MFNRLGALCKLNWLWAEGGSELKRLGAAGSILPLVFRDNTYVRWGGRWVKKIQLDEYTHQWCVKTFFTQLINEKINTKIFGPWSFHHVPLPVQFLSLSLNPCLSVYPCIYLSIILPFHFLADYLMIRLYMGSDLWNPWFLGFFFQPQRLHETPLQKNFWLLP